MKWGQIRDKSDASDVGESRLPLAGATIPSPLVPTRRRRGGKRGAIYARYSSRFQHSIDDQVNECRRWAGAYGTGNFLYDWTPAGHQTGVTNPAAKTATLTYDGLGRVTRRDYANGAYSTQGFDPAGNLTLIANVGPGSSGTQTLTYDYNAANRRTSLVESDGTVTTWAYDNTYQLARERRTKSGTFVFDLAYSYDAAGNRTLQTAYDAAGVMAGVTTSTYSDANRLLTEVSAAGTTTTAYDPAGNRTRVDSPQGTTWYEWDAPGRLPVLFAGGGGGLVKGGRCVHFPGETPMANTFLTMLDAVNVHEEHFSDSNGRLSAMGG